MRRRIEIQLYRAKRAADRDAQSFLPGDILFTDGLPANFSGERLLIEPPAAAKEHDAALEFGDHVRGVVDSVWKFQPG